MKTFLAVYGAFILTISILGAFGVGNFVMIYGPDKVTCIKGETK